MKNKEVYLKLHNLPFEMCQTYAPDIFCMSLGQMMGADHSEAYLCICPFATDNHACNI